MFSPFSLCVFVLLLWRKQIVVFEKNINSGRNAIPLCECWEMRYKWNAVSAFLKSEGRCHLLANAETTQKVSEHLHFNSTGPEKDSFWLKNRTAALGAGWPGMGKGVGLLTWQRPHLADLRCSPVHVQSCQMSSGPVAKPPDWEPRTGQQIFLFFFQDFFFMQAVIAGFLLFRRCRFPKMR